MKTTDLKDLDPATVKASAELDALMASEVMGWMEQKAVTFDALEQFHVGPCWVTRSRQPGPVLQSVKWSPSTNVAHAVEALLKAEHWRSETFYGGLQGDLRLGIRIELDVDGDWYYGQAYVNETNGDKALAMALAICRAILAALQAAAEAKEEK